MQKAFQKILNSKLWWCWLLLLLAGINYLASDFHLKLDLTKEKRYTLSKATKDLLKNLDDDVQIDVFLKGSFPSGFRKLANTSLDFLRLLKDRTGKINYRFISPYEKTSDGKLWGDSLASMGAQNIDLTVQVKEGQNRNIIFPVALITYKGEQSLVNLFPGASRQISQEELNTAEALMEYQFVKSIDRLTQTKKPGVAYATGNGEPMDGRTYKLRTSLEDKFKFNTLNIKNQAKIPDDVDLLLIVKPSEQFGDDEKLKIDQYVMRGGKLLCFLDNLYAEMDSFRYNKNLIAYDRNLNLTDLFFRYGVRVNTDLAMDLRCDVNYLNVGGTDENPQMEFLPWNYFPLVTTPKDNHQFALPGYMGTKFVNSIDTIKVANVKKTPLLVTSDDSRLISTPALISLNENKLVPKDENYKKKAIPVAMLLEGRFISLYKNRITKSQSDFLDSTGAAFRSGSDETKIIVVADGDMPLNEIVPEFTSDGEVNPNLPPRPLEMGWNRFTYIMRLLKKEEGRYFMPVANQDFFLNCVEYLTSNPAISETRNKAIVLRLLDSKKVKSGKTTWQLINIALPVLLVIIFGWFYQEIRKRKYAA